MRLLRHLRIRGYAVGVWKPDAPYRQVGGPMWGRGGMGTISLCPVQGDMDTATGRHKYAVVASGYVPDGARRGSGGGGRDHILRTGGGDQE